jgi:hypothetical protein
LSLDSFESRLPLKILLKTDEERIMTGNQPYDQMTLMRFQLSMLSLAATLDIAAPVGSNEESTEALVEAVRLRARVDRSEI